MWRRMFMRQRAARSGRTDAGDAGARRGGLRAHRWPHADADGGPNTDSDPHPRLYDLANHPKPNHDEIQPVVWGERALAY